MSSVFEQLKEELKKRNDEREISPLEKWVHKFFEPIFMKIDNWELEKQVDFYFIDIAFPDVKFGVELDGKEFHKDKIRDGKRDDYLRSKGWEIYRIPSNECWKPNYLAPHLATIWNKLSDRPMPYLIAEMNNIQPVIRKPYEPLYDKCPRCKNWHDLIKEECF